MLAMWPVYHVLPIEEVRQFGTVMSSNCMKDLDCVSVCPTDALKFGLTKPPLFRSWRAPRSLNKKYDFSLGEDLLITVVFVATLPIIRGLYDAVSFLLALAISALLAYFTRFQEVLINFFDNRLPFRLSWDSSRVGPSPLSTLTRKSRFVSTQR